MNAVDKSFLLLTNGAVDSLPALDYGIWLAALLRVPVTLLGIIEKTSSRPAVETVIENVRQRLERENIRYNIKIQHGSSRKLLCAQAIEGSHLAIVGPLGRPSVRRWLRGRSFRRILKEINTPLLYVKEAYSHLRRILLCMGGLGYAVTAEQWAVYLARQTGAALTILHVVEPIAYDYPVTQAIQNHWEEILETDTPQGQNLRAALNDARSANIQTTIHLRQGDIVHEIEAEVRAHDYDLIVMGSPHSSQSLRHLFMPNVTADIAELVACPVMVVEFGQGVIFD